MHAWEGSPCPSSATHRPAAVRSARKRVAHYRIKLGDNAQHREQIILVIQTSSRISFENTIKQVIDKSKTNLYEMVIVYPHTISEGLIDFT
jgi:hypothetical protein